MLRVLILRALSCTISGTINKRLVLNAVTQGFLICTDITVWTFVLYFPKTGCVHKSREQKGKNILENTRRKQIVMVDVTHKTSVPAGRHLKPESINRQDSASVERK